MGWAENAFGTKPLGFKTRQTRYNPIFFGNSIRGNDDAIPLTAAPNPDRLFLQFRIEGDFAARKEAVAIHMQDSIGRFHLALLNLDR